MNEDLNTQISQILADTKVIIDNQNKILSTVPNSEVLKNELSSKVDNDKFKPILDAMNLHLSNANFTENGYTKLPNGLILQWGVATITSNIVNKVFFPIAMTKILSVQANTLQNIRGSLNVASTTNTSCDLVFYSANTSDGSFNGTSRENIKVAYFVIGF